MRQTAWEKGASMAQDVFRIGCGAGFAGDRLDAAVPVVEALIAHGGPACLMFETLAERTLALAQLRRQRDGAAGYLPTLEALLTPVLRQCVAHRIPIVGNFGAANPLGAARQVRALAHRLGCGAIKVAAVSGDDLLETLSPAQLLAMPFSPPAHVEAAALVAANAYLGAEGIAEALSYGADVVVTGRVADPALALGPLRHHFGWRADDWDRLAAGVLAGHLLECGAQVSGGYFADPGIKEVPDLARVGYPIAEVSATGDILIGKPADSGGEVSVRTVKEQMLYEVHDPAAYLTPDVTLDLGAVQVAQAGPDRVAVRGARGKPRPATLKATVCFDGGWLGEGEISYAGLNCAARGRLAIDILRQRLRALALPLDSHFDLIGMASLFNDADGDGLERALAAGGARAPEVRVRMALRGGAREVVERALQELEALYTAGPAGGGGVRTSVSPLMNSTSVYVERGLCAARVTLVD